MKKSELQYYAMRCPETNDHTYNEGKKNVVEWNFYTESAKYFLMCENETIED